MKARDRKVVGSQYRSETTYTQRPHAKLTHPQSVAFTEPGASSLSQELAASEQALALQCEIAVSVGDDLRVLQERFDRLCKQGVEPPVPRGPLAPAEEAAASPTGPAPMDPTVQVVDKGVA